MDRLASCHLNYGFLYVPNRRGGRSHPTAPGCQNLKTAARSLSLNDRRGLISPAKHANRGLISSVPVSYRHAECDDGDPIKRLHDMQIAMQAVGNRFGATSDPLSGLFFPIRTMGHLPGSIGNGDRRTRVGSANPPLLRRRRTGEVALSLRYCPNSNTLHACCLQARDLPVRLADCRVKLKLTRLQDSGEVASTTYEAYPFVTSIGEPSVIPLPAHTIAGNKMVNLTIMLVNASEFQIVSQGLLNGDEELGHMVIGPFGSRKGAKQWREVMRHPGMEITLWEDHMFSMGISVHVNKYKEKNRMGSPPCYNLAHREESHARVEPFCFSADGTAAIRLPGYIRFIEGEVEFGGGISANEKVKLELTAEHNSFFIGKVCNKGRSGISFVPDEACSIDNPCELVKGKCQWLQHTGRMDVVKIYPDFLPLPSPYAELEGEWTVKLSAKQGNQLIATLALMNPASKWTTITVEEEADETLHTHGSNTHAEGNTKPDASLHHTKEREEEL